MTYRPYPNADRARHQLGRHGKRSSELSDSERLAQGLAALRSAGWSAQELVTKWRSALGPRPAGSEEKSA